MSKKNKVTRQGVRDLNSLPSKPRGIRLDDLPLVADANCKHLNQKPMFHGGATCLDCGDTLGESRGRK